MLRQLMEHEGEALMGNQRGATMADLLGQVRGAPDVLQRLGKPHLHHHHQAEHGQVGRLAAMEALGSADFDAASEHPPPGAEQTAHVVRVGEATQRTSLLLRGARHFRQAQCLAVLGNAKPDLAAREVGIAPQRVNSRLFDEQPLFLGIVLGAIEQRRRLIEPVEHRKAVSQSQQGAQSRTPRRGDVGGQAKGGDGFVRPAQALQQLAGQIGEGCPGRLVARQGHAAPGQRRGLLDAVSGGRLFRGREIGLGRPGRIGDVEMPGLQRQVALAIPAGGGTMKLPAPGLGSEP